LTNSLIAASATGESALNEATETDGSHLVKHYRSSGNFTSGDEDGGAAHIIAYLMFTIYGAFIGAGIMYLIG